MLINRNNSETSHVKFISYTGRYPNLCSGILTLEIDGEIATFGYGFKSKDKPKYDKFWSSGGCVSFDEHWNANVDEGSWVIDVNELPEKYRKYAMEINEVFNDNVPWGCCGGCL
jgi:hypothetical protein